MGLDNFILTCEKDNKELRKDIEYYKNYNKRLQQENKQLKEEVKDEEQWRIKIAKERDELHKECLNHIKQRDLYKEVIDEAREYVNKHSFFVNDTGHGKIIGYPIDSYNADDLLQILDKATKENK